jgi:uncharacterized protein with PQ loop repeat
MTGWIGSICLAICAIPQACKSYKEKSSKGIDPWFLGLWGVGEACLIVYNWGDIPLMVNYSVNLVCILVIARYL